MTLIIVSRYESVYNIQNIYLANMILMPLGIVQIKGFSQSESCYALISADLYEVTAQGNYLVCAD